MNVKYAKLWVLMFAAFLTTSKSKSTTKERNGSALSFKACCPLKRAEATYTTKIATHKTTFVWKSVLPKKEQQKQRAGSYLDRGGFGHCIPLLAVHGSES